MEHHCYLCISPSIFLDAFKTTQDLFWINVSWSLQSRDVCNSVSEAARLSSSSLLTFSLLLHSSSSLMLAASGVSPQLWPLAFLSNDLIFPSCLPPCHHSLSLPGFPGDRGMEELGGQEADGICLFWKLCIFSPQQLPAPFHPSSCSSVF